MTKKELQAKADAAHEARVRGGKASRRTISKAEQARLQKRRRVARKKRIADMETKDCTHGYRNSAKDVLASAALAKANEVPE